MTRNRVEYHKEYHKQHREQRLAYQKARVRTLKIEVLAHYGNGEPKCVRCGFGDIKALSIDQNQGFPKGYQTLCMNCQFIKKIDKKENRWNA